MGVHSELKEHYSYDTSDDSDPRYIVSQKEENANKVLPFLLNRRSISKTASLSFTEFNVSADPLMSTNRDEQTHRAFGSRVFSAKQLWQII
jgi:hypothetical protein